MIMIRKLRP